MLNRPLDSDPFGAGGRAMVPFEVILVRAWSDIRSSFSTRFLVEVGKLSMLVSVVY